MMLNKILIQLTLLCFLFSSISPSYCRNVKHDPSEFVQLPSGKRGVSPHKILQADKLHEQGITGKGTKIAIIDINFDPDDIHILNQKGCILPAALQNNWVLTPEERFGGATFTPLTPQERFLREEYLRLLKTFPFLHGNILMRILNDLAPGAEVVPLDLACISIKEQHFIMKPYLGEPLPPHIDKKVLKQQESLVLGVLNSAIRKAIDAQVDTISLSVSCPEHASKGLKSQYVNLLKEASQKGIALTFAAGNDSTRDKPLNVSVRKDKYTPTLLKQSDMQAFKEVNGHGMLFCGAMDYDEMTGEEFFAPFSQHSALETWANYLIGPGAKIATPYNPASIPLLEGTSISAPLIAGSLSLLKEEGRRKGLNYTANDYIRVLHQSGHELIHDIHHDLHNVPFWTYKALNLPNAIANLGNVPPMPTTPVSVAPQPTKHDQAKKTTKGKKKTARKSSRKRKASAKTKRQKTSRKKRVKAKKSPVHRKEVTQRKVKKARKNKRGR